MFESLQSHALTLWSVQRARAASSVIIRQAQMSSDRDRSDERQSPFLEKHTCVGASKRERGTIDRCCYFHSFLLFA